MTSVDKFYIYSYQMNMGQLIHELNIFAYLVFKALSIETELSPSYHMMDSSESMEVS